MGFAPPKDRSYDFQDYPRWLLWLQNVLANGELQLRGGCGRLEVLEAGCGWSGRGPGGRRGLRALQPFQNSRGPSTTSPSELLEICELGQEKMSAVFEDSNVYMLRMTYQATGVCLYMQDWEGARRESQKISKPYNKRYPLHSLNVASLWLKLGRLHMGLENEAAERRP
ncbi:N-lysine methyltransferase SMYD2 [Sciurus carolinensis]|uniref:N-lysine methyltransferase SMYD2 n=1 Tax=Sciurus carolinensis TaxID=30640 RepID=A0AA41MHR5_SCICA|nr:N-lysine methyltransferase SMYD2 [Sciurus carolinensis]